MAKKKRSKKVQSIESFGKEFEKLAKDELDRIEPFEGDILKTALPSEIAMKDIIQNCLLLDDVECDRFAEFCVGEGYRNKKGVEWPQAWNERHAGLKFIDQKANLFEGLTYMFEEWKKACASKSQPASSTS